MSEEEIIKELTRIIETYPKLHINRTAIQRFIRPIPKGKRKK